MQRVDKHTITEVAAAFRESHDLEARCAQYRPFEYRAECADWPTLQIDDVSGIPFLTNIVGVQLYQLRARVRAEQGDIFAATCPEMPAYERYNRDRLRLGEARFVYAESVGRPIEIALALQHGAAFERLCGLVRETGRLLIHPYMGIEAVWELAAKVHRATRLEVRVLAPPPPVTWFANDKSDLSAVVEALFGRDLLCETVRGRSAEELATHLFDLATRHQRIALKMTRCASAMGNRVLEASDVRATHRPRMLKRIEKFLHQKEWIDGDDVLVCAWEDNTRSPSSQMWIPPAGEGDPRLDGLYEQLLEGPEKMFLGSIPSRLDAETERAMHLTSLGVSQVYQALGYVGRCSFDFIAPKGALRFVECNGRWGGTSTPMHLMDRLFPNGRPAYRARDYVAEGLKGQGFEALADRVGDQLYDARTGRGRFVLYNVGCLPGFGKFDVIAIGEDIEAAERALEDDFPVLVEG